MIAITPGTCAVELNAIDGERRLRTALTAPRGASMLPVQLADIGQMARRLVGNLERLLGRMRRPQSRRVPPSAQ